MIVLLSKRVGQAVDVRADVQAKVSEVIAYVDGEHHLFGIQNSGQAQRQLGAANTARNRQYLLRPWHQRNMSSSSGRLIVNEIAPRPHNSGHYTLEACVTDQFEQHLRAVLGLPLGDASMKVGAAIMINTLGAKNGEEGYREAYKPHLRALKIEGTTPHWYGKTGCRPGRKMGHVTIVADTMEEALRRKADFLEMKYEPSDNSSIGYLGKGWNSWVVYGLGALALTTASVLSVKLARGRK